MSFSLRLLRFLCGSVLLVLVVVVLWGWITREFGAQARWSEELARLLLVWLALAGGALAYAENAHLGIDLLTSRWDKATARLGRIVIHALSAAFAGIVMLYGGGVLTLERWQSGQLLAAVQIPKAWNYAAVPVAGLAMLAFALAFLAAEFRHSRKDP